MVFISMILVLLASISNVNDGYIIGPSVMDYKDAQAYCDSQGTTLATISNSAERDVARDFCRANDDRSGRGCWIGLFEEPTNVWQWDDGSPLGYAFNGALPDHDNDPWHPGEPNNHGGTPEDCIHLFVNQNYNWNDAQCNDNNFPLCNDPVICDPVDLTSLTPSAQYIGWPDQNTHSINEWIGFTTMEMGDGITYNTFIVVHPPAAQNTPAYKEYDLNGEYNTFTATLGPARTTNGCPTNPNIIYGSFTMTMIVDGVVKYTKSNWGPTEYEEVSIDVSGANTLRLETTHSDNHYCDHPVWAGPTLTCDRAPSDSCEKGVNYAIDGQTCIAWGDPHFTTFNGEIHDYQGQMNSGKRRFYYVTPCADSCSDDMPFSIVGNHYSWGGRQVSGVDYLTLELYESDTQTYSVYISGSILAYALGNDEDYDQANANGNLLAIGGGSAVFGTRFSLVYEKPTFRSIRVVLTIDGGCTVRINMYGQSSQSGGRYRMHRMEILPLNCYQCNVCGLCGGYKRQRGAYQLETCNGGSVPFSRGWSANNAFAWDLEGNTWEKGYRDNECPICNTIEEPDDNYTPNITNFTVENPCDPDIEPEVIDACQDARDGVYCCDEVFCDEIQDACEFDACVAADGDSDAIDAAVQELFTDVIEGVCSDPTVAPTLDPTNSEGEGSGCTQNSDCGPNGICNNPGPNGRCSCEDGYRGDPDSGLDCEDINECGEGDPCPEVCINEDGGVSCACFNPIFDINGDGSECVEPPYVVAGPLDCQAAQEYCKNTYGTQLATIRTDEDRINAINALTDAGQEYGWIGLYSDDVETKWQFRSGATCPSASAYKCVDFWLESFKDGGAYRPRCIGPTENGYGCAVFYRDDNGVNNDKDVTDPIPFLCDE